jgi:alpha-methylacyl-CoA racemase
MAVGAIEPQFWSRLLLGLGLDAADLPGQWERECWPAMKTTIAEAFRARTRDEWTLVFDPLDACVTPVLSMAEAPDDAHLQSRGTLCAGAGGPQPAAAPRLDRTPLAAAEAGSRADAVARWGIDLPVGAS